MNWRTALGLSHTSSTSWLLDSCVAENSVICTSLSSYCSIYSSGFNMSKLDQVLVLEPSSELKFKGLFYDNTATSLTTPLR